MDVGAVTRGRGEEGGALLWRLLPGQPGDAVVPHVEDPPIDEVPAGGANLGEVVVGEGEVEQAGKLADGVRHRPIEAIVGEIELLHLLQAAEGERDGAGDAVPAGVEDGDSPEEADLVGQATGEAIVEEEHLFQGLSGVADAAGDGASEAVVGEGEEGGACAADVLGYRRVEGVVVQEEVVEVEGEDRGRQPPVEAVVAEVEEDDLLEADDSVGEGPPQPVVADVEFVEEAEPGEIRHGTGEVVGVGVEEGDVGEFIDEAEDSWCRQGEPVEVHAGDRPVHGLRRRVAGEARVGADVRPRPGPGYPQRVIGDSLLESLNHRVGLCLFLVLEAQPRRGRRWGRRGRRLLRGFRRGARLVRGFRRGRWRWWRRGRRGRRRWRGRRLLRGFLRGTRLVRGFRRGRGLRGRGLVLLLGRGSR
ncbi:unnamed protein product [Spirodela intermedia]|uniref:Uncharacterized protein n=1 Tax=Spirodela intermedia TaxID=51605 RepID=A0A7I8KBM7_SPIIN|nr:unnamed protein product [Spirodela intermedia]